MHLTAKTLHLLAISLTRTARLPAPFFWHIFSSNPLNFSLRHTVKPTTSILREDLCRAPDPRATDETPVPGYLRLIYHMLRRNSPLRPEFIFPSYPLRPRRRPLRRRHSRRNRPRRNP